MARSIAILLVFLASYSPLTSMASGEIDVMFVFADDVSLSLAERIALEIEYEGHANLAVLSSGMTSHTFNFFMPFVDGATSYDSQQKTWLEAVDWMDDQLDSITVLSAERELYESDIILMVVDDWLPVFGKQVCGNAGGTNELSPNNFSFMNSFNYAVAAIDRTSACPNDELVPHELGHVLYAEHQIVGNPPLDNSHNLQEPRPYNHGLKVGSQATIMYSPKEVGDSYYNLFSGSSGSFTTSESDVVRFLEDNSWDVVRKYRPIGQAPTPVVNSIPCFCIGKEGHQDVTFTSSDWTYSNQTFVVQRQYITGGPWIDVFEGDPNCIIFDVAPGGVWQRIKVLIEGMLDSDWITIFMPDCGCLNGGGPGF